jgi:NADPH:quinone reductase-like Zn-dependent oxidoreductase
VLLKALSSKGSKSGRSATTAPIWPRDEAELARHFAAGRLRPCASARYALADIVSALRVVQYRKTHGNVVIMMSDPPNWEV